MSDAASDDRHDREQKTNPRLALRKFIIPANQPRAIYLPDRYTPSNSSEEPLDDDSDGADISLDDHISVMSSDSDGTRQAILERQ